MDELIILQTFSHISEKFLYKLYMTRTSFKRKIKINKRRKRTNEKKIIFKYIVRKMTRHLICRVKLKFKTSFVQF